MALSTLKVPRIRGKTYPLKPLGSWMVDLNQRIEFFTIWIDSRCLRAGGCRL